MSTPSLSADHNLIFGLLALRMDFVSREHLVDAMLAWMLEKQPLGEILCKRGLLAEDERHLLDLALQKHLCRHGNDPRVSLSALKVEPSVLERLSRLADADRQAEIVTLITNREDEELVATHIPSSAYSTVGTAAPAVSNGVRFHRLREHARGGLGEVFVALDVELNREVALKEIQGRYVDLPDAQTRFLREAEITGKLEHPGVVPVYGFGTYPDGRPFYAMRFIHGESMQEAIDRFHKADQNAASRSRRAQPGAARTAREVRRRVQRGRVCP